MSIANIRIQHPVGQGSLHSSQIFTPSNTDYLFSFIYDCGALSQFKGILIDQIKQIKEHTLINGSLDFLFISHADYDHLSGLMDLVSGEPTVSIDTIILPLWTMEMRLISFGRSIVKDAKSAEDEFYKSFIINPAEALARLSPRRIIFVRKSPQGGAPGSSPDIPLDPPDGSEHFYKKMDDRLRQHIKLIGTGKLFPLSPDEIEISDTPINQGQCLISDDTIGYVIHKPCCNWLLAPFVDPGVESNRSIFLRTLSSITRKSQSELTHVNTAIDLITNNLSALKNAYLAAAKSTNATSLCLYSGPIDTAENHHQEFINFQCGVNLCNLAERPGWLGTGDAELKEKKRHNPFLKHYGTLLNNVSTFVLPHHGSNRNFDKALLLGVNPSACVCSADSTRLRYKHPHPEVCRSVSLHRKIFYHVNSSQDSFLREFVFCIQNALAL